MTQAGPVRTPIPLDTPRLVQEWTRDSRQTNHMLSSGFFHQELEEKLSSSGVIVLEGGEGP